MIKHFIRTVTHITILYIPRSSVGPHCISDPWWRDECHITCNKKCAVKKFPLITLNFKWLWTLVLCFINDANWTSCKAYFSSLSHPTPSDVWENSTECLERAEIHLYLASQFANSLKPCIRIMARRDDNYTLTWTPNQSVGLAFFTCDF